MAILLLSYRLCSAQFEQSFTGNPVNRPFVHRDSTEGAVELDTRGVPVEAPPLEPAAAAFHCDVGESLNQPSAVAFPAVLGQDKQIFEINARSAEKGRKVVEEQGKARFLTTSSAICSYSARLRMKYRINGTSCSVA